MSGGSPPPPPIFDAHPSLAGTSDRGASALAFLHLFLLQRRWLFLVGRRERKKAPNSRIPAQAEGHTAAPLFVAFRAHVETHERPCIKPAERGVLVRRLVSSGFASESHEFLADSIVREQELSVGTVRLGDMDSLKLVTPQTEDARWVDLAWMVSVCF